VSSVFWCLFDDDILKDVPILGSKSGRCVRGEIRERDKEGGGTGRVRSLVVLSHRIDVTTQLKARQAGFADPVAVNLSGVIPLLAGGVVSRFTCYGTFYRQDASPRT
jgi:hypothetical protein